MSEIFMSLIERYADAFDGSRQRFEIAKTLFPTGVTHDARMMDPFPVYINRAKGSKKWDVDGHELIDYFVGHGSHLLGHSPEAVVLAVQEQMSKGTHPGACHDLEIEWATWVKKLIPSAERVRFTGSGTEATMMALRLARLFTGRAKFLKFHGHFHGWHDYVTISADPPYESTSVPGVPAGVTDCCVAIPPNDLNRVEDTLKANRDIGAVILEPTGGHWGAVPIRGEFLHGLRELCTKYDVLLIFDEVITGFRVAPGGAQQVYGVTPDLTTLAKILAGGLPGGCVVGRADILAFIEARAGKPKMKHPGTYNANPLSASAGIATLQQIATGEPCVKANAIARYLRNGLNELFAGRNSPWIAYGDFSMVRVVPNYTGPRATVATTDNDGFVPLNGDVNALDGPKNMKHMHAVRQGMLLNGVDFWGYAGLTSGTHSVEDADKTIRAFAATLELMAIDGIE